MLKKSKGLKGFLAGIIVASLLWTSVFAAPVQKKITAIYNDIKIYVDGEQVQPQDGKGNKIEPFIADGTTYLPVRAIGQILGKDISWDGKTNSIYIGKKPVEKPPIEAPVTVTVSNADELVAALGSNKIIKVKPGTYNLSKVRYKTNSNNVSWTQVMDGDELTLTGIVNLTIEGDGKEQTEIVVEPRYANIFKFTDSSDISLKNLKLGHTIIKDYECDAGVVDFERTDSIKIDGCTLYGCGSEGISAFDVNNLDFTNSVIENCNFCVMYINNSNNMNFTNSTFRNCTFGSMFNMWNCEKIVFDKCLIENNQCNDGYEFLSLYSSDVKFVNSKFVNNKSDYFRSNDESKLDLTGTTFEGNTFDENDAAPKY
jgi:hypothetical protein